MDQQLLSRERGKTFDFDLYWLSWPTIQVDWLVLYFPYILITATVGLLAVEKIFLKIREGNIVQNKFFALMVGYGILQTDEKKAGREELIVGNELESDRNLVNLKQKLENSSSYFSGYLAVQVIVTALTHL